MIQQPLLPMENKKTKMMYKKNCPICKKTTTHLVIKFNLLRGVRLRCLLCSYEPLSFFNIKNLKEIK